jgi:hypothetical protein
VIGADGRNSPTRKNLGFKVRRGQVYSNCFARFFLRRGVSANAYRGLTTQPKPALQEDAKHASKVENSQLPGIPQILPSRQYLLPCAMAGEESAKRDYDRSGRKQGKDYPAHHFFLKMKLTILRKAEYSLKRKAAMDRGRISAVKFVG